MAQTISEKVLAFLATVSKQRSGLIPDRPLGRGKDRTWRESKGYRSRLSRSNRRKK